MSTNTGGHAFPAMNDNGYWVGGMTLRDYFAAKAMQSCFVDDTNIHGTAKLAYQIADAMLKAREQ